MNVIDKRNKIFSGLLMGLFICFAVFLAAISLTVDKPATITRADVYEGDFYTSDGVCLTELKNLDSSSPEKKHARSLKYPEAYSHLLGYNSTRYGTSGLRDRYSDWLYDGKRNKIGKDLQLTINHNLQLFCYDELNAFGNKNGSIVVIDNETGAIKALVSTKESGTFDANEVDSLEISELPPEGFLIGDWELRHLPGSTFKVLSAIALIENGNDDYVYNDKTGYINVGGGTIHNAGNSVKGELGLKDSLKESANVYYVSALDENEGFYDQLKDVAERFKIGEEIQLDFCILNSSFDYTPENEFQKALAVFGQGNESAVTPIQNAMIFGCIMNNGTMMKPYVVKTNTERGFFEELFNMNCEVKPEVLAKNVISKKTAKRIKEAQLSGSDFLFYFTFCSWCCIWIFDIIQMRDLEMEEEMRINFHNSFINWFNRTKSNRNSFIAFSSPAGSDSKIISFDLCGDTENLVKLLKQINNIIYCFTKKDQSRVNVNSEDKEKAEFMDENIIGKNFENTFGRKIVSIKEETKLLCENNDPLSEDYLTFESLKKFEILFSFGCRVRAFISQ